jgi:hypothetical protein
MFTVRVCRELEAVVDVHAPFSITNYTKFSAEAQMWVTNVLLCAGRIAAMAQQQCSNDGVTRPGEAVRGDNSAALHSEASGDDEAAVESAAAKGDDASHAQAQAALTTGFDARRALDEHSRLPALPSEMWYHVLKCVTQRDMHASSRRSSARS